MKNNRPALLSDPWRLFLDDERAPGDAGWSGHDVLVARTCAEAELAIGACVGLPVAISFDHDLGENQPVAVEFMWWLINGHLDGLWDCSQIKTVQVHSANIKGAENLIGLWEGFCKTHEFRCTIIRVKALSK